MSKVSVCVCVYEREFVFVPGGKEGVWGRGSVYVCVRESVCVC